MSKTLTSQYPETLPATHHMTAQEFEREAKLSMTIKLYETGKLSSSQAASVVELPRVHFLCELARFGASPQQLDAGDLAKDLAHAEQALVN